jgi:hypothetical protein
LGKLDTAVNPLPQLTRTLEGHHTPWRQDHILASRWVSPLALILVLYAEFTKAGNQDIITGF